MLWKRVTSTALVALALMAAPLDARASLVTNGDFTQYTTGPMGPGRISADQYSYTRLTDWSAPTGNNIALLVDGNTLNTWNYDQNISFPEIGTNKPPGNYVVFDADRSDGYSYAMSQTISGLTVGDKYDVSFSWGGIYFDNAVTIPTTEKMYVTFGSDTQGTATVSTSPSHQFTGWMQTTFHFTATSTSQLLTFWADGGPAGEPPGIILGDVSLNAVPEPSSIVMATLGTLGLVAIGLRRRAMAARA